MSITEELREYADALNERAARESEHGFSPAGRRLERIANRIDEEHEREVQQAHADGLNEQMDFHDNFVPSNYTLLPVDADGKVIHIGDKLVCDYTYGKTITVLGFGVQNCHDADKGVFAYDGDERCWFNADCLHHVEHTTVEEVLRELVAHVTPDVEWEDELFADYADRIREAVEHEEDK